MSLQVGISLNVSVKMNITIFLELVKVVNSGIACSRGPETILFKWMNLALSQCSPINQTCRKKSSDRLKPNAFSQT
jgi:hypothetical protein